MKPKHQINAKVSYMNNDNFINNIKTEDFQKGTTDDLKKWFVTSNYNGDDKIPLTNGMNKKLVFLRMNQEERL